MCTKTCESRIVECFTITFGSLSSFIQQICVLNHHIHLKYIHFLYVSYTSIKLEKIK